MKNWILAFLVILTLSQAKSQSVYYQFNDNCKQAYEKLLFLQLDSAQLLIEIEEQENPNNLIPVLLANYRDFLQLVLSENKALFEEIKDRKKDRLNRWEEGPDDNPWFLSGQAQIKLQWAFTRVLFDEYFTAATEINSAYHLLEKNKRLFPQFLDDNMGIGILHAMIGVVPEQYQWAMGMLGLYGSIGQGLDEMQEQLTQKNNHPFSKEALFYLTFVRLNLQTDSSRFQELINIYENDSFKEYAKKSPLLHFSKAAVLLKMNNDKAIEHLKRAPYQADAVYFYYSDFLLGQALLFKLSDESGEYFKKYLLDYSGKNYKKTALQKWAWGAFVKGDTASYIKAMKDIPNIGASVFDADKVAQKESTRVLEESWLPDLYLLRSRLQFDGHYYQGALNELSHFNFIKSELSGILEYHYRRARILHEMNRLDEAKKEYALALERGEESERYFAANSALKLGEIAELQAQKKEAAQYYRKVLDLDFSEYRKGIRAKAKAGLQRVEKN